MLVLLKVSDVYIKVSDMILLHSLPILLFKETSGKDQLQMKSVKAKERFAE